MSTSMERLGRVIARRTRFSAPVAPGPAGDLPWTGLVTIVNSDVRWQASTVTSLSHWSSPYPTIEGGTPGTTCAINLLKSSNRTDLTISGGLGSSQFFDELGEAITTVRVDFGNGAGIADLLYSSGVRYRLGVAAALRTYLDGLNIPLNDSLQVPLTITKVA